MARIEELCTKPASVSHEQIQNIVLFLSQSEGLAKHVDSFTEMLSLLQLKERTHFILAPILADDSSDVNSLRYLESFFECTENDFDTVLAEIEKEISMADIMKELGYGCTTNTSVCKEMLSLFSPLNEVTLSRILCTMAWTHIGLEDSQNTSSTFCSVLSSNSTADSSWLSSWNVDVLIDSIKELVIYSDEERKFNKEITVGLIRSELLNLAEYNVHLAKLIDGGRNKAATDFSVSLVQTLVVQEPRISVSELYSLMDTLEKLASRPGSAESLQQLVEIAKNSSSTVVSLPGFDIGKEDMIRQSRDKKVGSGHSLASREDHDVTKSVAVDPAGFLDQVSHLFAEWCRICELPGMNDASYAHYISQLQQSGLLKGDDITDHFFCILMELSVTRCLVSEVTNPYVLSLQSPQQAHDLSFIAIDMYSKLVVLILKYCAVDQGSIKVILLAKILSVIVRVIQKDALENKSSFNPRLYFRLFVNWLSDFGSPDTVLDGANFQVLTAFADAFHALQPLKVPGWSFAWLELVSHRSFMPQLLMSNSQKGWPFIHRLLIDLFKFMEPYVRNDELGETVRFLYKGTLRVLLLLLHDFPEFLCGYYFSFCDVIPPSCIQMRNIILCAFPHNMELPYPLTPNLKVDLVPETSQSPCILSEVDGAIKAMQIKTSIDEYLKSWKKGSPLLAELKQSLLLPQSEAALAGTQYNVPLINSLVLYLGMQAIYTTPVDDFSVSPTMDIFQVMITDLDPEGRYLFLNSVANQLRYPSSHTFYFSLVLLYLFSEASQDVIQEQIMRVLLERLIVKQPHPWGLLATFIKLVKNPQNDFWNRPFIRHERKIVDELFELVARPYGRMMTMDGGMVPGGVSDNAH